MSDSTITITTDAAAGNNEAIPVTETATPVAQTTPTDTTTALPETTSTTTPTTSSTTSTSSTAFIASTTFATSSISSTTFATSSISSTSSAAEFDPFTGAPFFTSGGLPPWATNSGKPFNNPFLDQTSNGLTTGAKAGIGVGVAALMLSIVAVALLILRMRKREQALQAETLAPPPYESPTHSNASLAKTPPPVPEKSQKRAPPPPPLVFRQEASQHGTPLLPPAPIASKAKDNRRKSNKNLRPRRNSNLAPVSEEEPEDGESRLALVTEGEILPSPTPSTPKTPRTPRTTALYRLNGDQAVPSPTNSHFPLGPNPSYAREAGDGSPSNWNEKRLYR